MGPEQVCHDIDDKTAAPRDAGFVASVVVTSASTTTSRGMNDIPPIAAETWQYFVDKTAFPRDLSATQS